MQLAHLGFVIVGDDKYGDFALNKTLQKNGLKRMFLHSATTKIRHPLTQEKMELTAPMPAELNQFLLKLTPTTSVKNWALQTVKNGLF